MIREWPWRDGTPARARWFDANGEALTSWFETGVPLRYGAFPNGRAALHLLLDRSIAIFDGAAWIAAFRDGSMIAEPAPEWLRSRPGERLATLPGGRGYAVLSAVHDPTMDLEFGTAALPSIEVLTRAGESCGTLALPRGAAGNGVVRTPFGLWVGQDGTLLESAALTGPAFPEGLHCAFRWWPELFGR